MVGFFVILSPLLKKILFFDTRRQNKQNGLLSSASSSSDRQFLMILNKPYGYGHPKRSQIMMMFMNQLFQKSQHRDQSRHAETSPPHEDNNNFFRFNKWWHNKGGLGWRGVRENKQHQHTKLAYEEERAILNGLLMHYFNI